MGEFERMMGDSPYLAGGSLSLADLYLVPVVHYMMMTPDKALLHRFPGLTRWWHSMNGRPSVTKTAPQLG